MPSTSRFRSLWPTIVPVGLVLLLSACGSTNSSGLFGGRSAAATESSVAPADKRIAPMSREERALGRHQGRLFDLFGKSADENTTVEVNKYLWQASLEVLNFLPIESIDPFTGVIVTGYGRPPGGGRAYRATIYVQDTALEARSLKVALQSQGGGSVSAETIRAVEDAILTRARQLRIRDTKL